MTAKMDQFPAINSNPVLSVAKDGVILYSNEAGKPLLYDWGVRIGEKLPLNLEIFVQRAISRKSIEKIEVNMGKKVYFIVFHLLPEQECVNIYGFDISDRKKPEGKLREIDTQETASLELANIIDVKAVQSLMSDFYTLAHIPMALVDLKGNVLVAVGWQDICTRFHRIHPETCKHCVESDTELSSGVNPGGYKLYKCKNNMWDVVTPIIVEGQHVGNIFSGQFFFEDETLDYELFRSQARQYGFNEEEYIKALEKVPRLSRKAVDTSMAFFMTFANMISQLSYSNIKLSQSLAEHDAVVDALQESEKSERARSNELAVVLDAVPVSVYIAHDPQALQITGNRLSYEWLRIPVGTNFSKSAPEGEKPEMFKLFKDGIELQPADMPSQLSATGIEINDCELDIVSADGEIRSVLGNARPLRDEQGNLRGSVSAFIDITERKKAEEALRLSNLYNRSLIEASLDPLVTIGRDGKITDTNYATEQVTGYSRNELIGTDFSDYFTDPEKARTGYQQAFMRGEVRDYSLEIRHKVGHITPVLYNASVYRDENGKVIGVFAVARDITERKRAEEALKKAHDTLEEKVKERTAELQEAYTSLKESEERLADSQKIAHIGNWDWNIATNEEYWSDELYHIFGLDSQFELNHNTFLDCIHPDDLDYVNNAINEALNGKPYYIDYRIILPDGEERIIYSEGGVLFDENNAPTRMRGIVQDITERRKAEETLTNIETARKKEIHHRIKNNLQVISSLLDLQAEQFRKREDIRDSEVLEAFRESQDRVISMALIHEELYKGGEFETLNFSPYIEELTDTLFQTYRLGNTDISLNMDLEDNLLFDMDTAVPLGIIINELVSNSLKHAFTGRDRGEIQIKLHREETTELEREGYESTSTSFTLNISDNGVGIPENFDIEELDSLGMQLVTSLVDQLDGELELKRNNGTEFTIRFTVTEKR
ncbi:PocR ligand-binding domain-containing protein [Methanosarcina sp.]|uniref:PocR ligand-binding domain-containing protein n=1 Tax=Methanosarcina sp. TaxID=2213 RepID=UPI003C76C8A2